MKEWSWIRLYRCGREKKESGPRSSFSYVAISTRLLMVLPICSSPYSPGEFWLNFSRLASWAYCLFLKQFIHVSIIALIWYYSCLLICFPFELMSADKIFYSIFVSLVPFPVHILNYHVTDVNDFFWSK